jgi:hypothetical protein
MPFHDSLITVRTIAAIHARFKTRTEPHPPLAVVERVVKSRKEATEQRPIFVSSQLLFARWNYHSRDKVPDNALEVGDPVDAEPIAAAREKETRHDRRCETSGHVHNLKRKIAASTLRPVFAETTKGLSRCKTFAIERKLDDWL